MALEVVEIMERVIMYQGEPVSWWKSYDHGRTWTKMDCSPWNGKPPFIMFTYDDREPAVVQRTQLQLTEGSQS